VALETGHVSEKGMKSVELNFCEDCVYGKQKRISFSTVRKTLKAEKLELVHTDVWSKASDSSLRGDNGGEYYDDKFKEFCTSRGIRRVKIVPENPHQNGVAEHMNKTILERARSM